MLLADRTPDEIATHRDALQDGFYALMQDPDFATAISNAAASPKRVQTRFAKASAMIAGVLDADTSDID